MNPAVIGTLMGTLIPIVAIIFGVGIACISVWTEHKRKAQLLEQLHRERMLALEKGVEPPAIAPGLVGFLQNKSAQKSPRYVWPRAMRNGLLMLFGGVVLFIATVKAGGEEGAFFTLIPSVIGIANLVYAAVLWHQAKEEPATPPANGNQPLL